MSVRISSIVPASTDDDDDDGDSVNGNLLNVIHFPFSLRSILFLLRNQLLSLSLSLSLSRCRQTPTHGEKNDFPTKHTQGFLLGSGQNLKDVWSEDGSKRFIKQQKQLTCLEHGNHSQMPSFLQTFNMYDPGPVPYDDPKCASSRSDKFVFPSFLPRSVGRSLLLFLHSFPPFSFALLSHSHSNAHSIR